MTRLIGLAVLLAAGGCTGASTRLAASITETRQTAQAIRQHAQATRSQVQAAREAAAACEPPAARQAVEAELEPAEEHLAAIETAATVIEDQCDQATEAAAGLEERTSVWERLLTALPWLAAIALAVYLGAGYIVRPILQRVGVWISPAIRRTAEMDLKQEAGQVTLAEAVAARRAGAPGYEAARRKAKARQAPSSSISAS